MASTKSDDVEMWQAGRLAKFFGCSLQWLRKLASDGVIPPAVGGRYPAQQAVLGYVNWLKSEDRRGAKAAAENGLRAARQREVELRIAREEGRLVDMEDVEAVVAHVFGTLRAELSGVPAAVSRDRSVRASVEQAINGALSRCSGRIAEACEALRAGRDPLDGDAEDDA